MLIMLLSFLLPCLISLVLKTSLKSNNHSLAELLAVMSHLTADHRWSPLWLLSHHVSISWHLNTQWVSISRRFTHLSRAGWPAEAWLAVHRSASFLSFWFLGCWCDDAPLSNARVCLCDAGSETSEETQSYFRFLWACVCVLFVYVFNICVCVWSWWSGDSLFFGRWNPPWAFSVGISREEGREGQE